MITITRDDDVVTLINVFSCDSQNQQRLIDSWIRATEETLGKLPGIISTALIGARTERASSTTPNGRALRIGKISSSSVASPGLVKWGSMPSQRRSSLRGLLRIGQDKGIRRVKPGANKHAPGQNQNVRETE
jgi:hypothetical protein